MRRILVISSHVAYGTIGLAAMIAPLQWAGHDVTALPTVVLSNHPGHARFAGKALDPALLQEMTAALDANDWLGSFDALLSGYLPSAGHVAWVAATVERMRTLNPNLLYICDPILGDDPRGLYIDAEAANAIRDRLVPIADVLMPNRYELAWLSGRAVQSVEQAISSARHLARPKLVATSIAAGPNELANVCVGENGVCISKVAKIDHVPHGTGDLFAGLLTAALLQGASDARALGHAVGGVRHALTVSRGSDRLLLSLMNAPETIAPAPVESLA